MSASFRMKRLTCSCGHSVLLAPTVHVRLATSGEPLKCPRCGHQAKVRPLTPDEAERHRRWLVASERARWEQSAARRKRPQVIPRRSPSVVVASPVTWGERLITGLFGLFFLMLVILFAFVHPILAFMGLILLTALFEGRPRSQPLSRAS